LADGGGALPNYQVLLRAMATQYPDDRYYIVCLRSTGFAPLAELGNVTVREVGEGWHKELTRLRLGLTGLGRIAQEHRVDVIWCINVGPYRRTGIPQVLSVPNSFQVYPWAMRRYHPDNFLHLAALRWFFRRALRSCDGVHVQTGMMKGYLGRIKGAPARVAVIPKAVESLDDLAPAPLPDTAACMLRSGLGRNAFTFLYVATGEPHKNHKTLLSAMQFLRLSGARIRVALTLTESELVGIGGLAARDLIQNGYVVPLGWVAKEHLRALYDACSACVMPSVLESLSSAHLEAMHWGKPQVCADLPYARDLCTEAALYTAAEDPAAWAANMQALARDAALQSRLVKAGCERMKEYPATWKEVAQKIRAFLAEVVESTRQTGEVRQV
jgi:glycosyltransferase involved in cell wall biosynthesis